MRYLTLLFLAVSIMYGHSQVASTNGALVMPKAIAQVVKPVAIQTIDFTITNRSTEAISIIGYNVICSCTSLGIKTKELKPNETTTVRVYIRKSEPYITVVFLEDSKKTWYRVDVAVIQPQPHP